MVAPYFAYKSPLSILSTVLFEEHNNLSNKYLLYTYYVLSTPQRGWG